MNSGKKVYNSNRLYSLIRKCDTPPSESVFWRTMHFFFFFFASVYGQMHLKRIKRNYPEKRIVVFTHASNGDVLVANRYYGNFSRIEKLNDELVLFDSRIEKLVSSFDFPQHVFLSPFVICSLEVLQKVKPGSVILYQSWEYFPFVQNPTVTPVPESFFKRSDPPASNTVLLSPYEKALSFQNTEKLGIGFWEKLAEKLSSLGYNLATNCPDTNEEPCISGTESAFPKLDELISYCENCEYIISVRSGFADFVASSGNSKLLVLYPNNKWLEKYNLKTTWENDKIEEIVFSGRDEEELIDGIIHTINGKGEK